MSAGVAGADPICEHFWAWMSPAGTSRSARICQFCHEPDPDWLNHTVEVDLRDSCAKKDCVHCEFGSDLTAERDAALAQVAAVRALADEAIDGAEKSLSRGFGGAPFPAMVFADAITGALADTATEPTNNESETS